MDGWQEAQGNGLMKIRIHPSIDLLWIWAFKPEHRHYFLQSILWGWLPVIHVWPDGDTTVISGGWEQYPSPVAPWSDNNPTRRRLLAEIRTRNFLEALAQEVGNAN